MQENHRNGQEESDIAATSEPYTPLRKEQGLKNCILNKSCQFSLIQCFLKFLFVQSSFHRECDKCTKINFSDKVFTRHGMDMDRICLNAQCQLITTTWPTPYFYYLFDDKIFVTVDKNAGIFLKHIW